MNYGISVLFRMIPLSMGAVCFSFGLYVMQSDQGANHFVAGHVLVALTAICFALFTTAAVIIRQLTNSFSRFLMFALPAAGYAAAIFVMLWGLFIISRGVDAYYFVAGHVVFGVGLVSACVSTVAAASSKFTLIPLNAAGRHSDGVPSQAYSKSVGVALIAVPVVCAAVGFFMAMRIFSEASSENYVVGHVLAGLSAICACLVALVATVVRQVRNSFNDTERWYWSGWVFLVGSFCIAWGLLVLVGSSGTERLAPGCLLIGIGMVCYSIISKVWLLALVWRRECLLANRIPLIPVVTCLGCLFFSSFMAEAAMYNQGFYIPARVMVGLGAVCFTLFSIVSILEAGTSSKK
ncbi:DUF2776 family protein [Crenobacter caeni]|uniref:DUF2776 domain-containing protein n=1 Tax=Crenobacter caeni TaxID=2705474 RepID=A0A6B2KNR2_9NEIS|nr:DUF2776 family protein [Crenobacter caeni]NDV11804.1 DUF2776 domain-containing protein [Crenobacter caeni]